MPRSPLEPPRRRFARGASVFFSGGGMAEVSSASGPGPIRQFLDRWLLPYLPYPHFMSLAPLDVVLRLLYRPFAWIPVVYWPRLALLIAFSLVGTVVSLPERI